MWRKIKISVQDKTKCRKARKSELNLKSDIGRLTPREATHHLNENNDNWLYFQNNEKIGLKKKKVKVKSEPDAHLLGWDLGGFRGERLLERRGQEREPLGVWVKFDILV